VVLERNKIKNIRLIILMSNIIKKIFKYLLLIVLLISFYFFIDVLIFKHKDHNTVFTTWQFPMLLALYLDIINN
jgi:hypothetical protein